MKRMCVLVGFAALAGVLVSAQPAGSVADEVVRLARAVGDATIKKDRAALEQLYATDYSYIHSNGVVQNKKQDITDTVSADSKWTSFELTDTNVRVYGDAAVLTGSETLQGGAKGYVPGARRITEVFVKRNGRWQQVGGASTIVSQDASSAAALSAVKELKAKTVAANTPDERAVLQVEEASVRADLANDAAKAKALRTDDSSFVTRTGAAPSQSAASQSVAPGPTIKSLIVAYDRIRAYGTLAVAQGSLLWTDAEGFSPGVLRFTRVWVKQGSEWKLAAEQRTPIAAAPPAS